jgi:predicted NAD-dependent protein-ADP-ribosyltransferase YbiA (DUF1768 family)
MRLTSPALLVAISHAPVEVRGIGLAADHEHSTSPEHWPGLNLLGFALMEVRQRPQAPAA